MITRTNKCESIFEEFFKEQELNSFFRQIKLNESKPESPIQHTHTHLKSTYDAVQLLCKTKRKKIALP